MRQRIKAPASLLIVSLAASSCAPPAGDFCDVADPIRLEPDVARQVVEGDRPAAERIDSHNRYGERACGW